MVNHLTELETKDDGSISISSLIAYLKRSTEFKELFAGLEELEYLRSIIYLAINTTNEDIDDIKKTKVSIEDIRLSDERRPLEHTHKLADIVGLDTYSKGEIQALILAACNKLKQDIDALDEASIIKLREILDKVKKENKKTNQALSKRIDNLEKEPKVIIEKVDESRIERLEKNNTELLTILNNIIDKAEQDLSRVVNELSTKFEKKVKESKKKIEIIGGPTPYQPLAIKDEGTLITAEAKSINFTGAGVTASNSNGNVTVNIPAGISGSGTTGQLAKWASSSSLTNAAAGTDYQAPISTLSTDSITQSFASNVLSSAFTGISDKKYALKGAYEGSMGFDLNDLDSEGNSLIILKPDTDGYNLSGVRPLSNYAFLYIYNGSDDYYFNITNEDVSSTDNYRFRLPTASTLRLNPREGAIFSYDYTTNKMWYLLAKVGVNSVTGTAPIVVDNTDPANPIVTWSGTTDDVPEGSNLYFTDERAQDAVGTILTDSNTIDFTYNDGSNTITADIITNAATSEILYKTASGIDGATKTYIDSNGLINVLDSTTLASPSAGYVLGTSQGAGRRLPIVRDMLGVESRLQPFWGTRPTRFWLPNGANTTTLYAAGITIAFTGSSSAISPSTTSYFTSRQRIANVSGAAANSSATGRHSGLIVTRGSTSGTGGFYWVAECGRADTVSVSDARWIMSLYGTNSAIAGVEPSALTNILGFGRDSTDTDLQFMHNDNAGTCTKVNLGSSFPGNTNLTAWYRFEVFCKPNDTVVYYAVTRMDTGDFTSGSVNTNLPQDTVYLTPQGYVNNTATAAAVQLHYGPMYLESGA